MCRMERLSISSMENQPGLLKRRGIAEQLYLAICCISCSFYP